MEEENGFGDKITIKKDQLEDVEKTLKPFVDAGVVKIDRLNYKNDVGYITILVWMDDEKTNEALREGKIVMRVNQAGEPEIVK